jgi:hypothetical protein
MTSAHSYDIFIQAISTLYMHPTKNLRAETKMHPNKTVRVETKNFFKRDNTVKNSSYHNQI